MAKVLLINPSYQNSYGNGKMSILNPVHPTLSLMTIAASALKQGHHVEILDLSYRQYHYQIIKDKIIQFKPDFVGVTATTPLMNQARDISVLIKNIYPSITTIIGGPHVSALPYESLCESLFDIVVVGEGDYTFTDIINGNSLETIPGIYYRKKDNVQHERSDRSIRYFVCYNGSYWKYPINHKPDKRYAYKRNKTRNNR